MSSTALSRPRNMLLDTETSTRIVNNERKIYAHGRSPLSGASVPSGPGA